MALGHPGRSLELLLPLKEHWEGEGLKKTHPCPAAASPCHKPQKLLRHWCCSPSAPQACTPGSFGQRYPPSHLTVFTNIPGPGRNV